MGDGGDATAGAAPLEEAMGNEAPVDGEETCEATAGEVMAVDVPGNVESETLRGPPAGAAAIETEELRGAGSDGIDDGVEGPGDMVVAA